MPPVRGFLYSQVGYDSAAVKKALVRGPQGGLGPGALLRLQAEGKPTIEVPLSAWGPCWGEHWWVADFSALRAPGRYRAQVIDGGWTLFDVDDLEIGDGIVYARTAAWVGWRQLEKRRIWAAVQPGWFDAGSLWQEVASHAPTIVGLADLARLNRGRLSAEDLEQTLRKVEEGCDYLGQCQDQARKLGLGDGVVHDLAKAPESHSSNDAFMAALAWAKGAEALAPSKPAVAAALAARAASALDWLETKGRPVSPEHNMPYNQGWPEGEPWPQGWMTRWLLLALQAELLLKAGGWRDREDRIIALTQQVLARQVPQAQAEQGLWGHYYAYDGVRVTEKGWSHGMPPKQNGQNTVFGSDMGAVFAHPVHAFLDGLRLFPQHPLAPSWRQSVEDFARGYFQPACAGNPFGLLPRGVFGAEGLLHFAGLWHGCNTLYGQAAALAFEFEALLGDPGFGSLGWANLQWVCGLNAGITRESVDTGCVICTEDVGEGEALPASMIQGIGHRRAGNWTAVRGSVCNGFSTGRQFTYDVPPKKELDAPSSFTDEDWITHAGGFLMGLARS